MNVPVPTTRHHLLVRAASDDVPLPVLLTAAKGADFVFPPFAKFCRVFRMPMLAIDHVGDKFLTPDRPTFGIPHSPANQLGFTTYFGGLGGAAMALYSFLCHYSSDCARSVRTFVAKSRPVGY